MIGRPKKPPESFRGNMLRVRLTDSERAEIDRAAQAKGLDTSAWVRSEMLALARATTHEAKRQRTPKGEV